MHRCNCRPADRHQLNTGTEYLTSLTSLDSAITVIDSGASKDRNTVHLWIYFTTTKDIGEVNNIFLLPEGWRPKYRYYSGGVIYIGAPEGRVYPYCVVTVEGYIRARLRAGEHAMFDTTFMV